MHDRMSDYHQVSWAWMTSQPNVALIRSLRGSLMLGLFFDMLSIDVCTARHWQSSGWLVQELNICTVGANDKCAWHVCSKTQWPSLPLNTLSIHAKLTNSISNTPSINYTPSAGYQLLQQKTNERKGKEIWQDLSSSKVCLIGKYLIELFPSQWYFVENVLKNIHPFISVCILRLKSAHFNTVE